MDQRPDNEEGGWEAVVQVLQVVQDELFDQDEAKIEVEERRVGPAVQEPHVQRRRVFAALRQDCRPLLHS